MPCLTPDTKSKNLEIITQVSIVMHHTFSNHCLFWRNQFTRIILLTLLGLAVLFIHMNDLYSKPGFAWPTKPNPVLAHQAQLCLAHQAKFRIGPPSPISYWPNKPSLVLDHQAQSRTGSPNPALYWPTKPNFVLAQQAQSCTGPPSPVSYWPTKPNSVLAHQAQFCIGPPNPIMYWFDKPSSAPAQKAHLTWPAKPISSHPQSLSYLAHKAQLA